MKQSWLFFALFLLPSLSCAQQPSGGATQPATANISLEGYPLASDKVQKSDAQWRETLTPSQYNILREAGTESPWTGSLLNEHRHGLFVCAGCGNPLYSSDTKFESGTGWPSFYQPIEKNRVIEKTDNTLGMERTEVTCARCGGHLGHVFDDGPQPTGLRYCMNSAALKFIPITQK